MEDAVATEFALGEGLRIVLKRVRKGLGPGVNNRQSAVLLDQQEFGVRTLALDGSGGDIARHAQALAVCVGAHPVEFFDSYVVALAVLNAGKGKIAERNDNQRDDRAKPEVSASLF